MQIIIMEKTKNHSLFVDDKCHVKQTNKAALIRKEHINFIMNPMKIHHLYLFD